MLFSAIAVAVVGLFASSVEASPVVPWQIQIRHINSNHTGNGTGNGTGNHTISNRTVPDANDMFCGIRKFNPYMYHCFDGDLLCPIINGTRTAPCGTKKKYDCYKVTDYKCANGTLIEFPNFNHTHHKLNSTAPAKKVPHTRLKF
ncbi:hypothetical protein RUND412_006436 [Rhizina undulata]